MANTEADSNVIERLFQVIEQRNRDRPSGSYTAELFSTGTNRIAQKVGEEAVETAIAAVSKDRDGLVSESADLIYHLLVLWSDAGVDPHAVWQELRKRE